MDGVKNHPTVKNKLLNEEEQMAMQRVIEKQLLSKNMIDEIDYVKENAHRVAVGEYSVVPLLCFLSNDKAILKKTPTWGQLQRDYFSGNSETKFIELSCGHYVHSEDSDTIYKAIVRFFR